MRRQTGLPRAGVVDHLIATFRRLHGLADGTLGDQELALAETLVESKFSSPAWTADVP